MKIIILHGDHTAKIADRLTKFIDTAKKRGWKIERIEHPRLRIQLGYKTLFEEERFFILENLSRLSKKDLDWINNNHDDIPSNLIIVGGGEIPKSILVKLPKSVVLEKYNLPKILWRFLDSFYPGNARSCMDNFLELVVNEPPELALYLLARQLKDIYIVKNKPGLIKLADWRFSKLKSLGDKFTNARLKKILLNLESADLEAKTSQTALKESLDLIIASQLQ